MVYGTTKLNEVLAQLSGSDQTIGNLTVTGDTITASAAPASAGATGVAGTITWEAGFLYVCVATDTWQRVVIATW